MSVSPNLELAEKQNINCIHTMWLQHYYMKQAALIFAHGNKRGHFIIIF